MKTSSVLHLMQVALAIAAFAAVAAAVEEPDAISGADLVDNLLAEDFARKQAKAARPRLTRKEFVKALNERLLKHARKARHQIRKASKAVRKGVRKGNVDAEVEEIEEFETELTDSELDVQKGKRRRRRRSVLGGVGKAVKKVGKATKKTVSGVGKAVKKVGKAAKKTVKRAGDAVGDAFSKYGKKFVQLYNNFKKMFGSSFKMPKLSFGKSIVNGIKGAINKITNGVKRLMTSVKKGEEFLQLQQDAKMVAGGAYLVVKLGEKHVIKPIVDAFCSIVKVFTDPIKKAFNAIMKLVTGILPSWLVKVVAFGGLGALIHHFLFSAFTVGATWSIAHGVTADSFEAGFALELKKNLQIGKTGCYLGGSSGVNSPDVGVSTGFAVTVFKEYGNIAGDSITVGMDADVCKIFGLPCKLQLSAGMIWDNSNWHSGKQSVALKTLKTCFGVKGEEELQFAQELALLQTRTKRPVEHTYEEAVYMMQTMTDAQVEANILKATEKFFVNGFKHIKKCVTAVFKMWIGLTMNPSVGVGVSLPATGSLTMDYAYCNE